MTYKSKYIIDLNKCLGRGATADVFLGIKLDDTSQCAMKCSKYQLKKEISILRDLDHENIVRYYDSLDKFMGFEQVIVMEYCNRGSVYEFIELHIGLCDNMFLKMLECLNLGISYLRKKNFIHRDIKPGNMMVHQDFMGYYHIKLGDMGTAKRVLDDQTFPSLVGTEEYLHPDMYIRYLEGFNTTHRANVDLWSIAVTLYHAAMNELPFIPHNYSRSSDRARDMLRRMYTSKQPGIISGRQNSDDKSDITWSSKFSDKCRLSKMLQVMTAKLIGNLMNLDEGNTYDRFFEESSRILQKKRALMFNSLTGELDYLYLDNLSYLNLIEQISRLIGFPREDFMLLTRLRRLEPLSDINGDCLKTVPIKGRLEYTLNDDTLLVMITKASVIAEPPSNGPSTIVNREMSGNCEGPSQHFRYHKEAMKYSDKLMRAIYQVNNATNYIDCQIDCYKAIVNVFNEHVMIYQLRTMNEALPWQMKSIRDTCLMTESLVNLTELALPKSETSLGNQESLSKCKEEIEQLRQKASEGEKCGEQYFCKIVERREMIKYSRRNFDHVTDSLGGIGGGVQGTVGSTTQDCEESLEFLVHLCEELVNEVKLVPEDKANSEQSYRLEIWQRHMRQFKFYQIAKDKHVGKMKHITVMHGAFHTWMRQALNVMTRIIALRDFLKRQEDRRSSLRTKFLQVNEFIEKVLSSVDIGDKIKEVPLLMMSDNARIKSAIIEIKQLTEKTKNAFYKDSKPHRH